MAETEKTFGEILREAREEQGLSHTDVASQLNLRVSLIKDLEDNILESHTADVFTRGYVRSYAELLKIDSDKILKIYDDYVGNTANRRRIRTQEAKHFKAQKKKRMFLGIGLVSGMVVFCIMINGGIYLWYRYSEPAPLIDEHIPFAELSDGDSLPMTIEENRNTLVNEDDGDELTEPIKTEEELLSEFNEMQQKARGNDRDEAPVIKTAGAGEGEMDLHNPNANVVAEIAREKDEQVAENSSVRVELDKSKYNVVVPEPYININVSSAEIEEQRRSSSQSIIEINTSPNYNIHIEFSGDCWLDLKSGMNNRRVAARVYKTGHSLDFNVINMPLKFIIGAPNHVSHLSINDNLVDLSGVVPDKPYRLEVSTR